MQAYPTETKIKSDTQTHFTFHLKDLEPPKVMPDCTSAFRLLRHSLKIKEELEYFCHGHTPDNKQDLSSTTVAISHKGQKSAMEELDRIIDFTPGFMGGPPSITTRDLKIKEGNLIQSYEQGLVGTIHIAFAKHLKLKISASDFLLLFALGLSSHIENNAEKLRKFFVNDEGKQIIAVCREQFIIGTPNDWEGVISELSDQVDARIKTSIRNIIIDDLAIGTPITKVSTQLALLNSMKNYFGYRCYTECGIPDITLQGSPDDWEKLRNKVKALCELNKDDCLDLNWWLNQLIPVIDKICDAGSKNIVDVAFWSDMYKEKSYGSGNDDVTGWITKFFPYINGKRHMELGKIRSDDIPAQVSQIPLIWAFPTNEIPMTLSGGFLGTTINWETNTVQPEHFWCITYVKQDSVEKTL